MTPVYERYAGALFSAAEKLGCPDIITGEIPAIEELIKQCGSYLNDPQISTGAMVTILREVLSAEVSPLMQEFILIMAYHRHLMHFQEAAEHYRQLSGIGKAVVRLRVPFRPDPDTLERIKDRLIKAKLIPYTDKETEFNVIEDKELIGGLIASCNGYQIDASLKTALQKLRAR